MDDSVTYSFVGTTARMPDGSGMVVYTEYQGQTVLIRFQAPEFTFNESGFTLRDLAQLLALNEQEGLNKLQRLIEQRVVVKNVIPLSD